MKIPSRLRALAVVALSFVAVESQLHRAFQPSGREAAELVAEERATLQDVPREQAARDALRAQNPEWDLMRRMFVSLTLANELALHPERKDVAIDLDGLADGLLADDARTGAWGFLLPYARSKPFHRVEADGPRSLFVDGEIALVLAARELTHEVTPSARAALDLRVSRIERAMRESPTRSGESYPDEAWTFCNTTALAALALYDTARGTDHRADADAWIGYAKAHLVDPSSGLLVSSYHLDGRFLDRAEGSSIFMAAHALLLWDREFATAQWSRAKELLVFDVAGFTLAREWPRSHDGMTDVDSGPVIPLLDASPGASGLAVIGASAFGDDAARDGLVASLRFAAFPRKTSAGLTFAGAGPMGNAVVAYALSFGPLWERADRNDLRRASR